MDKKLEEILVKLNKLDEIMNGLPHVKKEIQAQKAIVLTNSKNITDLEHQIKSQQAIIKNLEKSVKNRNLLIMGIPKHEENTQQLEEIITHLFHKYLTISISNMDIDNYFRIGKKCDKYRPILIIFSTTKIRNSVLKLRTKFKGSNIFINEDLSMDEQTELQELLKVMKKLKADGNEVKLIRNKLYVNGVIQINENSKIKSRSSNETPTKIEQRAKFVRRNSKSRGQFHGGSENGNLDSFLGLKHPVEYKKQQA